eukprot:scaffold216226_cov30-Tisochrysis_lutea.AAC.3
MHVNATVAIAQLVIAICPTTGTQFRQQNAQFAQTGHAHNEVPAARYQDFWQRRLANSFGTARLARPDCA